MRHTVKFTAALATLAAVTCVSGAARAQTGPDFTSQYQTWLALNYQGPVAGRFSVTGDVQFRAWDDFSLQALLARGALMVRVADGLQVGLGYLWQPAWRKHGFEDFVDEHRLFEVLQYQYAHPGTGFVLQLRTRFEQRFRHPEGDVELGLRARQLVRGSYPLTTDRRLTAVVWDEVFVNLTDSGHEPTLPDGAMTQVYTPQWQFSGFDQNRAFAGVGYQLVPAVLRAELGYMNQYVRRPNNPNNAGDLMGHTALLQLFASWR